MKEMKSRKEKKCGKNETGSRNRFRVMISILLATYFPCLKTSNGENFH